MITNRASVDVVNKHNSFVSNGASNVLNGKDRFKSAYSYCFIGMSRNDLEVFLEKITHFFYIDYDLETPHFGYKIKITLKGARGDVLEHVKKHVELFLEDYLCSTTTYEVNIEVVK